MAVSAVFMDRDGTLNVSEKPDGSYLPVNTPEELVMYDQALEGLRLLNEALPGLPKIVVTNQGGIELGHMSVEQLQAVHEKLMDEARRAGGPIDAIYFAPGISRSDPMRKPNPGMLLAAAEEHGIDLSTSYMVGDATADIGAGENAGTITIGLRTGSSCKDGKVDVAPDVMVADFRSAAEYIIVDYLQRTRGPDIFRG